MEAGDCSEDTPSREEGASGIQQGRSRRTPAQGPRDLEKLSINAEGMQVVPTANSVHGTADTEQHRPRNDLQQTVLTDGALDYVPVCGSCMKTTRS